MTSEALGLAHALNEPVSVELSTGHTVQIYPVSLSVLSHIAQQEERVKYAVACYQAFSQIAEDPNERLWEKHRRLPYFYDQWIGEVRTLARMITSTTRPGSPRRFAPIGRFFRGLRARRIIRTCTWQDVTQIVDVYRKMNDINVLVEAIVGKDESEEDGKKKMT